MQEGKQEVSKVVSLVQNDGKISRYIYLPEIWNHCVRVNILLQCSIIFPVTFPVEYDQSRFALHERLSRACDSACFKVIAVEKLKIL